MELFLKNIDFGATVKELVDFVELICGKDSVASCEIRANEQGRSLGYGFLKLEDEGAAHNLLVQRSFRFRGRDLLVLPKKNNGGAAAQPRKLKLFPGLWAIAFGNLYSCDGFRYLWKHEDVKLETLDKLNAADLQFKLELQGLEYRLDFPLDSIMSVDGRNALPQHKRGLLIQLKYPPRVYNRLVANYVDYSVDDLSSLMSRIHLTTHTYSREDDYGPKWGRTTDFTQVKALGQSTAIWITSQASDSLTRLCEYFVYCGVCSPPVNFRNHIKVSEGSCFATKQEVVPILSPRLWPLNLPLEIIYKLNYLIQDGFISPAGLNSDFFRLLHSAASSLDRCLSALQAFQTLEQTCWDPAAELRKYLRNGGNSRITEEAGQFYVKRVVVTPVKVYFLGPELEVSNRITRSFKHKLDKFLRVSFTEEDWDALPASALSIPLVRMEHSNVYKRILTVLQNGIQIGGMDYQFLAFSSSQLKDNSVWMFAGDEEVSADDIRRWMGDFLDIRNVAKCAARMGQSFSSSTHTLNVQEYLNIPDVERISASGLKYCFSDGIGTISKSLAEAVSRGCNLKAVPSAFQIRYRGFKGVVAVNPESSFKLSLRPSMYKFPSTQIGLDVITWTKRITCYLNRQIIVLLSTLGVHNSAFSRLQQDMVHKLDSMLQDRFAALELLRETYGGESHNVMFSMLASGYSSQEPYLNSLLRAFRDAQLLMLRTKSHVLVPKARRLMGCLDEYAKLNYGQCFVQVSAAPEEPGEYEIRYAGVSGHVAAHVVKGWVVVAKNPCLHPGDILLLQAVDVCELHHMVDCIVFPQLGHRPHPNETAGSDLDGDDYFVSWDDRLLPPCQVDPMEYVSAPAVELDHEVTLKEIQEFFLDHMANNSLGQICNAHVVHADQELDNARSEKCVTLAKLASIAVDFAKTGVPASLPVNLRPWSYPDFMEKEDKPSYKSTKIIGELYRSVRDHQFQVVNPLQAPDAYDEDLIVEGYEGYVEQAIEFKDVYDAKLRALMRQYEVSEAEVMSGSFVSLAKFYKKKTQGEVKERIVLACRALVKEAQGWFKLGEGDEDEEAKASAWYHVTYDPQHRAARKLDAERSGEAELLSFPWAVYDVLLRIKGARRPERRVLIRR